MYKIGFLGVGKMGSSILLGIINSGIYKKDDILIYDPSEIVKEKFKEYRFVENEKVLAENVEILIVAVKPQIFNDLKKYEYSLQNTVIVSIVAGKTIKDLESVFGNRLFIRVMPNTPALIGYGATAISKNPAVPDCVFNKVKSIFETVGKVKEIDDNLMNEIIPTNGSMPAYLYYFAKSFIENAVKHGIDYETAKSLASDAIIGSAKMIIETDKSIDELIKDVCSPKGATLEGLKVLEDNNMNKIIDEACDACIQRAYELSKL